MDFKFIFLSKDITEWMMYFSGITIFFFLVSPYFEENIRYYGISSPASDGKLPNNWSVFDYKPFKSSFFGYGIWQKFWLCDGIRDPYKPPSVEIEDILLLNNKRKFDMMVFCFLYEIFLWLLWDLLIKIYSGLLWILT